MKKQHEKTTSNDFSANIDADDQVKVARQSWRVMTGERIAEAVKLIGGQIAAAEAAGVSLSTLQRYMKGDVDPSLEAVMRLAQAVNLSLDWIATGRGRKYRQDIEEKSEKDDARHVMDERGQAYGDTREAVDDLAGHVVAAFLWLKGIAAAELLEPPRGALADLLRLAVSLPKTPENEAILARIMRQLCD
jgi:transcriptional regulator with XRE-family HTH domain